MLFLFYYLRLELTRRLRWIKFRFNEKLENITITKQVLVSEYAPS